MDQIRELIEAARAQLEVVTSADEAYEPIKSLLNAVDLIAKQVTRDDLKGLRVTAGPPTFDPLKSYSYHKPSPSCEKLIGQMRGIFRNTAESVVNACPRSRETSLALTHLENARMYAILSLAMNRPDSEVDPSGGDLSGNRPAAAGARIGMTPQVLAKELYTEYSKCVGGVAYNGDPLPSWDDFKADPNKQRQADAWISAAAVAIADVVGMPR